VKQPNHTDQVIHHAAQHPPKPSLTATVAHGSKPPVTNGRPWPLLLMSHVRRGPDRCSRRA